MREIRIDPLTRVEGLGRLYLYQENGSVREVSLEIFEAPRFFEKLLIGKKPDQVIDIVARICGLCPVAYQLTALEAFEKIFNIKVPSHIKSLRRVLYCGEWIASHSAHTFFMHLPDFFSVESFLELAKYRKDLLELGLSLRKAGNWLIELIGGRAVHPINIRVGGFYKLPTDKQLEATIDKLSVWLEQAQEFLELTLELACEDIAVDLPMMSLKDEDRYPMSEGKVCVGNREFAKEFFSREVEEFQKGSSSALYSRLRDGSFYQVGVQARVWNNWDRMPEDIKEKLGSKGIAKNPFESIILRSAEVVMCMSEGLRILERVNLGEPSVEWSPGEGEAVGITEAPRGLLYHNYMVDKEGRVVHANIIPPTSQNQGAMENTVLKALLRVKSDSVRDIAEKVVRCFDPCISCASHFIEVSYLSYGEKR